MAKKKHVVMARSDAAMKKGVRTSKGTLSFKGQSAMYVDDDVADEIDKTDGLKGTQDVWIHEDPIRTWTERYKPDGVHSYFFGQQRQVVWVWADVDGEIKQVPERVAMEYGLPILSDRKRKARRQKATEVHSG